MILEQRSTYAQILLCAYHTDAMAIDTSNCEGYTRVTELWSYDTTSTYESLTGTRGAMDSPELSQAFDLLFPGLRAKMWDGKFNDDYNNDPPEMHQMNLWVVQAGSQDLKVIWTNLFNYVSQGPQGGDDDTFDYWPSAWGVMLHFAEDLMQLGVLDQTVITGCQVAWDNLVDASTWGEEDFANEVVPRPVLVQPAKL